MIDNIKCLKYAKDIMEYKSFKNTHSPFFEIKSFIKPF